MSDEGPNTKYRLTVCVEAMDTLDGRLVNTETVTTLDVVSADMTAIEWTRFDQAKAAALRLAGITMEVGN